MCAKILIVDDHIIVRRGIRSILAELPEIETVTEAGEGSEAILLARENPFDLVLVDISMPGMDGLETLSILKQEHPQFKVLVLSMYKEKDYAIRAMQLGAAGYINKASSSDELVDAVRTILKKGKFITPLLAELLADAIDLHKSGPTLDLLSNRELQIFRMLASGDTITLIAGNLCISPKTVSTYKSRIYKKLNISNHTELVRYAMSHNIY